MSGSVTSAKTGLSDLVSLPSSFQIIYLVAPARLFTVSSWYLPMSAASKTRTVDAQGGHCPIAVGGSDSINWLKLNSLVTRLMINSGGQIRMIEIAQAYTDRDCPVLGNQFFEAGETQPLSVVRSIRRFVVLSLNPIPLTSFISDFFSNCLAISWTSAFSEKNGFGILRSGAFARVPGTFDLRVLDPSPPQSPAGACSSPSLL